MTSFKDIFSNRDKVIADREAISKSVVYYIKMQAGLVKSGALDPYFNYHEKYDTKCRIIDDIVKIWANNTLPTKVPKHLTYCDCTHIMNELHIIINASKNEKAIKFSKMTLNIFSRYQELLLFKEKRTETILLVLNIINAILTPIMLWYIFLVR